MGIIFGNETEALTFADTFNLGTTDVKKIALAISELPKANKNRDRIVMITRGAQPLVCAEHGQIIEFHVEKISNDQIVDTNGAGDALVGGVLASYVLGHSTQQAVRCGLWAASKIVQRSGCTPGG